MDDRQSQADVCGLQPKCFFLPLFHQAIFVHPLVSLMSVLVYGIDPHW